MSRPRLRARGSALLLSCLALSAAANAQAPASATAPGAGEPLTNVTIEARRQREEKRLQDFVAHITVHSGDRSFSRWHEPVCARVFGVSEAQQEFLLTRFAAVARSAGAPLAARGCAANLHIIATAHAAELVSAWVHRSDAAAGAGWRAAETAVSVPRPVRVWYNVELRSADGTAFGNNCPGMAPVNEVRVTCSAFATRLQYNERAEFSSLVVIVDLTQIADFDLGQLADYIAFTSLTRVNLDADLEGAPSILALFRVAHDDRPQGLTAWDSAYLAALYETNDLVRGQSTDIARSMLGKVVP